MSQFRTDDQPASMIRPTSIHRNGPSLQSSCSEMTPDEARAYYNFLLTLCIRKAESFGPLAFTMKARSLQESGIDVVSLTAGEPDFATPPLVKDAAVALQIAQVVGKPRQLVVARVGQAGVRRRRKVVRRSLAAGFGKQPRESGTFRRLFARSGFDDAEDGDDGGVGNGATHQCSRVAAKRIIGVGTTSVRTLESAARNAPA